MRTTVLQCLLLAGMGVVHAGALAPGEWGKDPVGSAAHLSMETRTHTGPGLSFNKLYEYQKAFLDNFLAPKNQEQAKAINSTLFSEDVQGRVDITRTFNGRELNTEYIFGLFANIASNAKQFTLLGFPKSYKITHFAASQNIASASTRFMFQFPAVNNLEVPITIDTWNTFNQQGQITQYDATFKWWDWAVDHMLDTIAQAKNYTLPQTVGVATQGLANSICQTATTFCNGTNAQYSSMNDCMNFLTKQIRFGKPYELGRNTLLCRMVHQNMVPFRPSVHCPHIGKTGGGYCVDDKTYDETVTENYFTNTPFAYSDKGPIVA